VRGSERAGEVRSHGRATKPGVFQEDLVVVDASAIPVCARYRRRRTRRTRRSRSAPGGRTS